MDISYAYVSPNEYQVIVKFYRDCSSLTDAPLQMDVYYSSASCGFAGDVLINPVAGTGQEISTGPYPPCNSISTCQGGTGYGVQEFVYSGLVTLPGVCTDWVISSYVYARNNGITTVNNPGNTSLYVEATLDNVHYPTNSSPVFSSVPVSRFCLNHTFTFSQGATDPNGDSLVFSLIDARDGGIAGPPVVTVLPYNTPYSGTNPIGSSPAVSINNSNGLITLTPNVIQIGVIAILVQEYHNGVLSGSVVRDMQVNIQATCNFPPVLQPSTFNNVTANCGDSVIYIHLSERVKCSSVVHDGTDFRLISPSGLPIPLTREIPINCVAGLTDSIELHLYFPYLFENGTYALFAKVGNDGNTLLNNCGNPMAEYDTARFFFDNCYHGTVNLTNVTVDNPNSKLEVYWDIPSDLPLSLFHSFDVYRSDFPSGPYHGIRSVTSSAANSYVDDSVHVPLQPYNYAVRIHLNTGYIAPYSDSIQSIYLTAIPGSDSLSLNLNWTPYWGWSNPVYEVMQSDDYGNTFYAVSGGTTSSTSFVYTKPGIAGTYLVRIQTSTGSSPNRLSRSNWYQFDVVKSQVIAPNVITPNGDGVNDTFLFQNLEPYPNSKLAVFNRWGRKVYESNNYQNDWKGGDLSDGVYYYTLKVGDKKSTEMTGTVSIIRNK